MLLDSTFVLSSSQIEITKDPFSPDDVVNLAKEVDLTREHTSVVSCTSRATGDKATCNGVDNHEKVNNYKLHEKQFLKPIKVSLCDLKVQNTERGFYSF